MREESKRWNYNAARGGRAPVGRMRRIVRTAHHEAGHAFLAYRNDFHIDEVAVFDFPQEGRGGECVISGGLVPADDLLLYTVAGPVSESLYLGANFNLARMTLGGFTYLGGRGDFDEAVEISRKRHGGSATDSVIEAHISYMAERVRAEYLEPNWRIVQRLAAALVEKKRLSGEEVDQICSASLSTRNAAA